MHPSVLLNSTELLDSGNFQIELRCQAFIITYIIKVPELRNLVKVAFKIVENAGLGRSEANG